MRAAAVVVGDEILSGHVRDANGHFIARRLAALGHELRSIVVVADDPALIAESVRREAEGADILFTCGGVGPTHDDRTMEGVARAAGVPLEVCDPIARRIEEIAGAVHRAGMEGDPLGVADLRKMALVPKGAEVIPGAAGLIPAVVLAVAGRPVVVLPGPPRELQALFVEAVEPRFLAGTGVAVCREEISHPFPESAVARALSEAQRAHGTIRIGSYPLEGRSLIRITGPEPEVRAAAALLRTHIAELESSAEGRRLLAFMARRREARERDRREEG